MKEEIKRHQDSQVCRIIKAKKLQVETGILIGVRMSEENNFISVDRAIKCLIEMTTREEREDLKHLLSEALSWKTPSDELLEAMEETERGEGEVFDTVEEMFEDAGINIK